MREKEIFVNSPRGGKATAEQGSVEGNLPGKARRSTPSSKKKKKTLMSTVSRKLCNVTSTSKNQSAGKHFEWGDVTGYINEACPIPVSDKGHLPLISGRPAKIGE